MFLVTTTLQRWGNSQGVRLPKSLLAALNLQTGSNVQLELNAKKDAIIVRPATTTKVRGRHKIEDLVAAMPKNFKAAEFDFGTEGRETW